MLTFHDQLRLAGAHPDQLSKVSLSRPSLFQSSPPEESTHPSMPRGARRQIVSESGTPTWSSLAPCAVLAVSAVMFSQQLGSAGSAAGQLLPSLVGATLKSLPELHTSNSGLLAHHHPINGGGGSNTETPEGAQRLQKRRLQAVATALSRLIAIAEAGLLAPEAEALTVRYARRAIEHLSMLSSGERDFVQDLLARAVSALESEALRQDSTKMIGLRDRLAAFLS